MTRPPDDAQAADDRRPPAGDGPAPASEIVHRAAAILGDEIAAGIVAAKQVEARFRSSGEIREQAPQEIMQRLRKDAHELVDILMDFVTSISGTLGSLVGQANGARPASSASGTQSSIRVETRAGDTARRTLKLRGCDGDAEHDPAFTCTDLVAACGSRLPASCVSFVPAGAVRHASPDGEVEVEVRVPEGVPAGVYAGLVRSLRHGEQNLALMEVVVERGS